MVQLIDGGLSTELERLGVVFDGPLWTAQALLSDPEQIKHAHLNYIKAGATLVITSSYQISRSGFSEAGLSPDHADRALVASVSVAREAAAGTSALVAASIGPYGATLHDGSEYRGNYGLSEDELFDFHRERIEILKSAQPDVLLAETIPDLIEARALARALSDSTLPVWVSFTAKDSEHLWSGAKVTEAVKAISGIKALEVISFNCVRPELVQGLVEAAKAVSDAQIAVYPNRGGSWNAELGVWQSPEDQTLASYWQTWSTLGLSYVGGCCGFDSVGIAELGSLIAG